MRISLEQPGTLTTRRQALAFLAHYGPDPQRIETWDGMVQPTAGASTDLVKDQRADMIFTVGFYPEPTCSLTHAGAAGHLLTAGRGCRAQRGDVAGNRIRPGPAGAYEFLDRDYFTTMAGMLIVVGPAAEPRTVY